MKNTSYSKSRHDGRLGWWLQIVVLCSVVGGLFGPSVGFDFAYDDFLHINYNAAVTTSSHFWQNLVGIFLSPTYPGDLYRPIPTASYYLTYLINGLSPFLFHLSNVVLYGLVCLVVQQLFLRVFGCSYLAFFAVLLFAVHPLHVEVVANVVSRTELLSAFFGVAGLLVSVSPRSRLTLGITRGSESKSFLWNMCLGSGLLLLAFLSKESALTIVPIAALASYILKGERSVSRFRLASWFVGIILCYLSLRLIVLEQSFLVSGSPGAYHPENPLLGVPIEKRFFASIVYLGRYLFKMIVPIGLAIDYSLPLRVFWDQVYSLQGLFYALLVVGFCYWVFAARERRASLFFGLWFFITFALTANLVLPIGTIMGDRLAFLPSVGVCGFLVSEGAYWFRGNTGERLFSFVCVIVIATWAWIAYQRVGVWRDNETVFAQAVQDNPLSSKAAMALAVHYYHWKKDVLSAERYFRLAHKIDPSVTQSARYMIDISLSQKNLGAAEYWCREVLRFAQNDPVVIEKLNALLEVKETLRKK